MKKESGNLGLSTEEIEELINRIGGKEVCREIAYNSIKIKIQGSTPEIVKRIGTSFDEKGRRIPINLAHHTTIFSKYCPIGQAPKYSKHRIKSSFLRMGLNLPMSPDEYGNNIDELVNKLKSNDQLKNVLNGPFFPILIPQKLKNDSPNFKKTTESFLNLAKKSYRKYYPNSQFGMFTKSEEYKKGSFTLSVVPESRYEKLYEKMSEGPVPAIHFPLALSGYSIKAAIEQMSTLPEGFVLSGLLDYAITFAIYPDILGPDHNIPSFDCSASESKCDLYIPGYFTPFFKVQYRYKFKGISVVSATLCTIVSNTRDTWRAHENYTSGLLYLGD